MLRIFCRERFAVTKIRDFDGFSLGVVTQIRDLDNTPTTYVSICVIFNIIYKAYNYMLCALLSRKILLQH